MDQGKRLRKFTKIVHKFCEAGLSDPAMSEFIEPVAKLHKELGELTLWIGMQAMQNQEEAGAAATDYLRLVGHLCFGYFWARMAVLASRAELNLISITPLSTARSLCPCVSETAARGGDQGW